jgi:hypothetical protein
VGLVFTPRDVSVGRSTTPGTTAGNRWGIDLAAAGALGIGTLSVAVTPDNAPWLLSVYPETYTGPTSGTGDWSTSVPTGSYTVVFGSVAGWAVPAADDGVVVDQGTTVLTGVYDGIPVFDPIPDQFVAADALLTVNLAASDPDGATPSIGLLSGPAGATLDDAGDGTAQLLWTPSAEDIGVHTAAVVAADGALSSTGTVSITVLAAYPWPAGVIADTRRPTFVWEPIPGAEWYYLWLSRNGATYFTGWVSYQANRYLPPDDLPAGDYTWWVRGWGVAAGYTAWSAGVSFSLPPRLPGAPAPVAPTGTVATGGQRFTWQPATNATWHYVKVEREGHSYAGWWVQTEAFKDAPAALPAGRYAWWVRGWNTDGYGPWSAPAMLRYNVPEGTCPTGTVTGTRQPVFAWTAPEAATWHQVWLEKGGTKLASPWVAGSASWQPASDLAGGSYRWWVRCWDAAGGTGPWSDAIDFDIPVSVPSEIVPVSPSEAAAAPTVTYTWQADPAATWYKLIIHCNGACWHSGWYPAGAPEAPVSIPVDGHVPGAQYDWWVKGWSPDGEGPWNTGLSLVAQ